MQINLLQYLIPAKELAEVKKKKLKSTLKGNLVGEKILGNFNYTVKIV